MQRLITILLIIGPFFGIIAILYLFRFYKKQKKARPAFNRDRLRSPGQSLLFKLESINEDLKIYLLSALLVPLVIYSIHISISYFSGAPETHLRIGVSACAAAGIFVFCIYKVIQLLSKRRVTRLGYEGELAAGRELDQIIHDGFYVLQDFPSD